MAKRIRTKTEEANDIDHQLLQILEDALTCFPPKIIGQFGCVSKHWNHQLCDPIFTESHRSNHVSQTRSDANSRLLITFSHKKKQYFYTMSQDGQDLAHQLTVDTAKFGVKYIQFSEVINGLSCIYDYGHVVVCNITTREIISLPGSSIEEPSVRHYTNISGYYDYYPNYSFGFDPVAKEYKVLCVWVNKHDRSAQCEVFTLGTDSWRRIDDLPHEVINSFEIRSGSCCVNGVIYWPVKWHGMDRLPTLAAFDVRDEKLIGAIEVPTEKGMHTPGPIRFGDRVALLVYDRLRVLEDYHNQVWIKNDFDCSKFRVIGTTGNNELLLKENICWHPPKPLKVFVYDGYGICRSFKVDELPLKDTSSICNVSISKHEQNLFRLKRSG